MTAVVLRADLTEHTIELSEHEALVAHQAAGAVVGFAGVVRDHDGGRTVTRLEYSEHPWPDRRSPMWPQRSRPIVTVCARSPSATASAPWKSVTRR